MEPRKSFTGRNIHIHIEGTRVKHQILNQTQRNQPDIELQFVLQQLFFINIVKIDKIYYEI